MITRDDLKRLEDGGATRLKVGGVMRWWYFDPKTGTRWNCKFPNAATYQGLNHILETEFRSGTPIATWYVGLITNAGFSAVSVNDTMASHAGWTEWVAYSGANRPAWGPAAAASGVMANTTLFTYTLSATGTLAGGFVTSGQAHGGSTGFLWATALQQRDVSSGATLSGSYTITMTPSS